MLEILYLQYFRNPNSFYDKFGPYLKKMEKVERFWDHTI